MSPRDDHKTESARDGLVRQKTQRPRKWRVLMHNDDFTTMEFVIEEQRIPKESDDVTAGPERRKAWEE